MASMVPGRRTAISVPSERPKPDCQPCLVVIAGEQLGRRIDLGADPVIVGRSEECAICIPSEQVSRRHAVVQPLLNRYHVVDLDSTNGTFVNEARVQRATLQDGDRIRIGKTVFKYTESHVELQYIQHIHSLADGDPLTGAYNKRYFDDTFATEVRRAHQVQAPLGLVLFDIDHFKKINDTYGHPAGDAVLKGVVATVKAELRQTDVLCRVGGEEFALILPNTPEPLAHQVAEFIRGAVEGTTYEFDGTRIPVTLSLGATELRPGESPEQLYRRADEKLYEAKRSGRNRVA